MMRYIEALGEWTLIFMSNLGRSGLFLVVTLTRRLRWARLLPLLANQIFRVGILSLPIILLSGLFIGMVVALQGYNTLIKFGASQQLGQLVALSIVRELGPVVTSLLFAGRAGSALTAEIGLMRTTDQIASMKVMAVDPLWRIIAPRLWAGIIALPILVILFNVISIWGAYLVGVEWLGVDHGAFWGNMQSAVNFKTDIVNGIIKTFIFGVVVVWVSVYQGYFSAPSAAGVSRSTTKSVVYGSLLVLALDFMLTAVMMGGW